MSTLAQLKTRLLLETNRGDLATGQEAEQALADAIDRAIEFWADTEFWFNKTSGSVSTVATTATVTIPAALRTVQRVVYSGCDLRKARLDDIQGRTETGQPTMWAESDNTLTLWPIPNAVYALTTYGLAELGTPASAASNAWTTDALDLIDATARKILYRDYFRDDEDVMRAMGAEQEALTKLQRESRHKTVTPLRSDLPAWRGATFDITRG